MSPVARHFNTADYGICKLQFMGIEAVRPLLKERVRRRNFSKERLDESIINYILSIHGV